ncbi:MAG: DUF1684 domain-containing protein, partial [Pseudomonadota bacterium]
MNRLFLSVVALWVLVACSSQERPAFDAKAHEAEILQWRAGRLERLKAPTGFLNQVGLYWLKSGSHTFGSAPDNDIVLPGDAADVIGTFDVGEDGIRMSAQAGVDVRHDGVPVTRILIADDTTEAPVMITHGSLAWTVIQRAGRRAVRVRDFEHPFVAQFGPLPYYNVDPNLRVTGTMQLYDEPRTASVGTVIEGLDYRPTVRGTVRFELDGQKHELEAYDSGDQLFFIFGDRTNRDDTYGAGRFLYSAAPDGDGETVLDF